jgi:hypothetical protein
VLNLGSAPAPATPTKVVLWWAKVRHWSCRWYLHVWLGIPLIAGFVGVATSTSQYTDIYESSKTVPRIQRSGVLDIADLRGQKLRLTSSEGVLSVRCRMTGGTSSCVDRTSFPLSVTIALFKYKGYLIILSINASNGNSILTEREQLTNLKDDAEMNKSSDPFSMFLLGFVIGITILVPIALPFEVLRRRIEKRQLQSGGR